MANTDYPRLPIDITVERKASRRAGWNRYAIRPARSSEVIGHLESYGKGSSRHWDVTRMHPCYDLEATLKPGMTPTEARKSVQGYLC